MWIRLRFYSDTSFYEDAIKMLLSFHVDSTCFRLGIESDYILDFNKDRTLEDITSPFKLLVNVDVNVLNIINPNTESFNLVKIVHLKTNTIVWV